MYIIYICVWLFPRQSPRPVLHERLRLQPPQGCQGDATLRQFHWRRCSDHPILHIYIYISVIMIMIVIVTMILIILIVRVILIEFNN